MRDLLKRNRFFVWIVSGVVFLMTAGALNLYALERSEPSNHSFDFKVISSGNNTVELRVEQIDRSVDLLADNEIGDALNDRQAEWILLPQGKNAEIEVLNIKKQGIELSEDLLYQLRRDQNEFFHLGEPMIMRGWRMAPLIVSRCIYNKVANQYEQLKSIEAKISFKSDGTLDYRQISTPKPSRYAAKIIRSLVLNPPPPDRDDAVMGGSIAFVIGEWDDVEEALQPLIEWKRRKGWSVDVIRVEHYWNRFRILNAIRDAYNEWETPPEFVVLTGDAAGEDNDNDYTLAYWNEQDGSRYPYETDHWYACVDGNDLLPDLAIGRLSYHSIAALENHVNKIISYESDPYIGGGDNAGWQLRAVVAATDSRSGKSSIDVCEWFEDLLGEYGYRNVSELYFSERNPQPNPTQFIINTFNEGVNFFLYRGWSDMNGFDPGDIQRLRNGSMLPFVILATCNTGEYVVGNQDSPWCYTEWMTLHRDGGAIGCIGPAGATHTAYNNIFVSDALRSIFNEGVISQGWALMRGKLGLYDHYAGRGDIDHAENENQECWETHLYIYNLMGDPSVELFTQIPRQITVQHPGFIYAGQEQLEIYVQYVDEETPAEGLDVCLYKPNEFQTVEQTGADGVCRFYLEREWAQRGEIQLTITAENVDPYLVELPVRRDEGCLKAVSWQLYDGMRDVCYGNENGRAGLGETVKITSEIENSGYDFDDGDFTAVLKTGNPQINILTNEVRFNRPPADEETVSASFLVKIDGSFFDDDEEPLTIELSHRNNVWKSAYKLPVDYGKTGFEGFEWIDDAPRPGDAVSFRISLRNDGNSFSERIDAKLYSLSSVLRILEDDVVFPAVHSNALSESFNAPSVYIDEQAISGSVCKARLILKTAAVTIDTIDFEFTIGEPDEAQPFGPDNYGYYCLDDADEGWIGSPEYDWVEIDPNLGGEGRDTNLEDRGENQDASTTVDLPFNFRYYGEEFDLITICTNGWMAFGDHSEVAAGRNRRISRGESVPAMLCPFWDDLITLDNRGIYYWLDRQNNRFIVEWSRMKKLGPRGNAEATETFQVILYNQEFHPTLTGDGEIIFQYRTVTDDRSCYQAWDTPFATVGVSSPSMTDGLQYTYWGQRHPNAAELENTRAIKFTTNPLFDYGVVAGRITDAGTNEPVSGAQVTGKTGITCSSDENGVFRLAPLPLDSVYSITIEQSGYLDAIIENIDLEGENEIELELQLRKPELQFEPNAVQIETLGDNPSMHKVMARNPGSAETRFKASLFNGFSDTLHRWEPLLTWNSTDSTGDYRMHGIEFVEGRWVLSGGNNDADINQLYIFDRNGAFIDSVRQPIISTNGIRDMAYYDGYLYGVFWTPYVIKFDPETGEEAMRWETPEQTDDVRALTIDPRTGLFYISSEGSAIYQMELINEESFEVRDSLTIRDPRDLQVVSRCYGLSWYENDPDGHKLYASTNHDPDPNDGTPEVTIYKIDMETKEVAFLTDLPALGGDLYRLKAGACITDSWMDGHVVFAGVYDTDDDDIAAVFSLDKSIGWFSFEPRSGIIPAGRSLEMDFLIDPAELELGSHFLTIDFEYNVQPGKKSLPIMINVVDELGDSKDSYIWPEELTVTNYPNPFNAQTVIYYTLPHSGEARLSMFDLTGREIYRLVDGFQEKGEYRRAFNARNLPAGVYFLKVRAMNEEKISKILLIK